MKPWHDIVKLREDVRTGDMSLSEFAADLGKVMANEGDPLYSDVEQFFRITYATDSLKRLAKEVVLCLAGQSEKSVRQMSMTFGGGKTHALITLYHLVHNPSRLLSGIPAVQEFQSAIGTSIPETRVAAFLGDKMDTEKGFEAVSPTGEKKWLRQPWSIIAWQLAGHDGLKVLQDDIDVERSEPPAQPLWENLFKTIAHPSLILMDEVLMYARRKAASDGAWIARLQDFFQYLTQAVAATPQSALVASILSTDPNDYDELGSKAQADISTVIGRVAGDMDALPVEEKDVPEVIRRRLFQLESIPGETERRAHVRPIVERMAQWDESVSRNQQQVENKFVESFPFHPDLIETLYIKWTQLDAFQRTRGVLQTFAKALRNAHGWDNSPVVGPEVYLSAKGDEPPSDAIRKLADSANKQEGKNMDWATIVAKELDFAADVQKGFPSLKERELESAVVAVFLHSQPLGQKAELRELLHFAASTVNDRISFENALRDWAQRSWFLDDDLTEPVRAGEEAPLPKEYRLGPDPNIRQMAAQAKQSILATKQKDIDAAVLQAIRTTPTLISGAANYGAKVHHIPDQPHNNSNFPKDDEDFHFVILRPEAASEAGKPSDLARRMFEQDTSVDDLRVHKNLLVLLAPTPDGVERIRDRVLDKLAWEHVSNDLKEQLKKAGRGDGEVLLSDRIKKAEEHRARADQSVGPAVRQAYAVGIAVDDAGAIQAYGLQPGGLNAFDAIIKDDRFRIKTDPINADALLPSGPYQMWHADQESRRVKDLVGAFAQNHKLPKVINVDSVYETIRKGCLDGLLVIRVVRPDKSVATYWRIAPNQKDLEADSTEAWLPEKASLTDLPSTLLTPGHLQDLWIDGELPYEHVMDYFQGGHVVQVEIADGYSEPLGIPAVDEISIGKAVNDLVLQRNAWLISESASRWGEPIEGAWGPGARLRRSPKAPALTDLLPTNLPDAWTDGQSSIGRLVENLKSEDGLPLPWTVLRPPIASAISSGFLTLVGASSLPQTLEESAVLGLKLADEGGQLSHRAESELKAHEIQELADRVGEIEKLAKASNLVVTYRVSIEVEGDDAASSTETFNEILASVAENLRFGD